MISRRGNSGRVCGCVGGCVGVVVVVLWMWMVARHDGVVVDVLVDVRHGCKDVVLVMKDDHSLVELRLRMISRRMS